MLLTRFATVLSIWATLCLSPCFPATAAAQQDLFAPMTKPVRLSPIWVRTAQGTEVNLKDLWATGQTTYLHLWAPSCAPCVKEIKMMEELWPRLTAQGINIIVMADDRDGLVTVPSFAKRYGIASIPLYIDKEQLIRRALNGHGLPMTYKIDGQGNVLTVHEGTLDWDRLAP